MNAILDTGALIALDRRDRRVGAMLDLLQREGTPVRSSGGAVAQVWRDGRRQANLARTLRGIDVAPLDERDAKRVGELLRSSGTGDVVDGHVALLVDHEDTVLTSDDADITALLIARRVDASVVHV